MSATERVAGTAHWQRQLRDAFGRFATGVAVVVTRRDAQEWAAVTVNSFTSVSLEPPLLLFSIAKKSNCRVVFESCERFSANLLRHDQQLISSNFARPSTSRWDELKTTTTPEGDLLIDGAIATFQCRVHSRYEAGDHVLVLGLIERFALGPSARPLAFFGGSYGSFTSDQGTATSDHGTPLAAPHDPGDFTLGWG